MQSTSSFPRRRARWAALTMLWCCLGIAAWAPVCAYGQVSVYLDSNAGTDSPECGLPGSPCRTFRGSLARCFSSDCHTVIAASGSYVGDGNVAQAWIMPSAKSDFSIVSQTCFASGFAAAACTASSVAINCEGRVGWSFLRNSTIDPAITFVGLTFQHCTNSNVITGGTTGSALTTVQLSSITVLRCAFYGCQDTFALSIAVGALPVARAGGYGSLVDQCLFQMNQAGAVCMGECVPALGHVMPGTFTLSNSVFIDNTADTLRPSPGQEGDGTIGVTAVDSVSTIAVRNLSFSLLNPPPYDNTRFKRGFVQLRTRQVYSVVETPVLVAQTTITDVSLQSSAALKGTADTESDDAYGLWFTMKAEDDLDFSSQAQTSLVVQNVRSQGWGAFAPAVRAHPIVLSMQSSNPATVSVRQLTVTDGSFGPSIHTWSPDWSLEMTGADWSLMNLAAGSGELMHLDTAGTVTVISGFTLKNVSSGTTAVEISAVVARNTTVIHPSPSLTLQGVTCQQAVAVSTPNTPSSGACLYLQSFGVDALIKNMRATETNAERGGAVLVELSRSSATSMPTLEVRESYFADCSATYGGAIMVVALAQGVSMTIIDQCEFYGCLASLEGGSVSLYGVNLHLRNTYIKDSGATWGGGVFMTQQAATAAWSGDSTRTLALMGNVTITDCYANSAGGGIYMNQGANLDLRCRDSGTAMCLTLIHNEAVEAGGAVYCDGAASLGDLTTTRVVARNNSASCGAVLAVQSLNVVTGSLINTSLELTDNSAPAGSLVFILEVPAALQFAAENITLCGVYAICKNNSLSLVSSIPTGIQLDTSFSNLSSAYPGLTTALVHAVDLFNQSADFYAFQIGNLAATVTLFISPGGVYIYRPYPTILAFDVKGLSFTINPSPSWPIPALRANSSDGSVMVNLHVDVRLSATVVGAVRDTSAYEIPTLMRHDFKLLPCPAYHYTAADFTCRPCPIGTYIMTDGKTIQPAECKPCPQAATCNGSTVLAKDHYWLYTNTHDSIIQPYWCPSDLCQQGGCAPHRDLASPLCGRCEAGYTEWAGTCSRCESSNGGVLFGLICALLVYMAFQHVLFQTSPGLATVLVFYLQNLRLILTETGTLAWQQAVTNAFNLQLGSSLVAVSDSGNDLCAFHVSPYGWLALEMFTPLVMLCIFLVVVCAGHLIQARCKLDVAAETCLPTPKGVTKPPEGAKFHDAELPNLHAEHHRHYRRLEQSQLPKARLYPLWSVPAYLRTAVGVLLLTYQSWVAHVFSFFSCVTVGDQRVVAAYPGINCRSPEYHRWAVFYGVMLAMAFLFPILIGFLLYRLRDGLSGKRVDFAAADEVQTVDAVPGVDDPSRAATMALLQGASSELEHDYSDPFADHPADQQQQQPLSVPPVLIPTGDGADGSAPIAASAPKPVAWSVTAVGLYAMGVLFEGYKMHLFWFAEVMLLVQTVLAAISAFALAAWPFYLAHRLLVLAFLFCVLLSVHVYIRPYHRRFDNWAQTVGLLSLTFTCSICLYRVTVRALPADPGYDPDTGLGFGQGLAVLVPFLVFVLLFLYQSGFGVRLLRWLGCARGAWCRKRLARDRSESSDSDRDVREALASQIHAESSEVAPVYSDARRLTERLYDAANRDIMITRHYEPPAALPDWHAMPSQEPILRPYQPPQHAPADYDRKYSAAQDAPAAQQPLLQSEYDAASRL